MAELRKKRGWTQEVLAEKANITVRTIQRIENGTDVSLDTLASISNALLVPVSELFERIDEEAKEVEIMDMSKEQLIQLKYRQTITVSITLLVIAAILLVMSILGVEINELASGYNTTLSWLAWVRLETGRTESSFVPLLDARGLPVSASSVILRMASIRRLGFVVGMFCSIFV